MDGAGGHYSGSADTAVCADSAVLRRLGSIDGEVLAVSTDELAERVGIAIPTAREWRRLGRVPVMWLRSVRALVLGDLGVIDDVWRGWRLCQGALCSPDGGDYVFSRADVMSLPVVRLRLAETERALELARRPTTPPDPLTLQGDFLSSRWEPHRYPTDDDRGAERAETQWERAQAGAREHAMRRHACAHR